MMDVVVEWKDVLVRTYVHVHVHAYIGMNVEELIEEVDDGNYNYCCYYCLYHEKFVVHHV